LQGPVDQGLLRQALAVLSRRHEAVRGVFSSDGEHFLVYANREIPLSYHDLSTLTAEQRERRLHELERAEVETEFDLQSGPLHRAMLIRLEHGSHRFVYTAHHAACDGWSAAVLMTELAALYRAGVTTGTVSEEAAGLSAATSFIGYAAAQRARQASEGGRQDLSYWVQRLSGTLSPVALPSDRPHSGERTYASKRIDITLGAELLAPLRQTGAKAGCTFLMTFIGLVQAWVARRTGQTDVVLGVPSAGQAAAEEEALVGHCVHLLPVRAGVDLSKGFNHHLRSFKPLMLDAFDHQQITYGSLLPQLTLPYVQGRIPLVPLCVNIDAGLGKLDFGGFHAEYTTIPRAFESFELFLNAVDHRDRLVIECSFNTALFDESTIRRWIRELTSVAAAVVQSPEQPLSGITLRSDEDERAFAQLNATDQARSGTPVHRLVEQCAQARPDAIAVRFGNSAQTYAELDARANRLAHVLQASGVTGGSAVGVCLERTDKLIPALLAILKCGAAYVPLDPSFPSNRLQAMVDDASVNLVLTDAASRGAAPVTRAQLVLDAVEQQWAAAPSTPLGLTVSPEDRAYILFTSGSTGRPKGVEIPHRAFENILLSMQLDPGFSAADALLAITTISFDIAGVELFLPLVCGGTVVLCSREQATDPSELMQLLEDRSITFMQATPATWYMLTELGWKGRQDLRVVCTGEAFPQTLQEPLLARAGAVWNMYGPTETCIYSTLARVRSGEQITIGKPVANTQVYVLDAGMQPVAVGDVGELYIGGRGVALGYVGRAELTRERFVPNPYAPTERMYRTGDLGRLLPSGDLLCLGRADSQVKIRGFRIELGEIESVLARAPGVLRVAVVAREFGQDDLRLVAYVAPERGAALKEAQLTTALQAQLPPYMVPQHIVVLAEMPIGTSGKIDRKALPDPTKASRSVAAAQALSPRAHELGDVEAVVSDVFHEVLRLPEIERTRSFFELGGHSVLAIRIISRLKERFGLELPLRAVFQAPTIAQLAEHLLERLPTDAPIPPSTRFVGTVTSQNGPVAPGVEVIRPSQNQAAAAQLREIWSSLLRIEVLDEEQSFFELGGHSMLAVRMASRVRELLGVELPLRVIFQAPTLGAITQHVLDALSVQAIASPLAPPREEIEF
jgi:amino acid adenylation domain-containing protein